MKNSTENNNTVSVKTAAAQIKSGDTIWVGNTTSISKEFLDALTDRQNELKNVTILANKGNESCKVLDELKYRSSFKVMSFFKDGLVETYKNGNKVELLRSTADETVDAVCRQFGVNTIAVAVCPPDSNGNCNVGQSGNFLTPAINTFGGVTKRIAIIDGSLPAINDNSSKSTIKLSAFDCICQ